MTLDYTYMHACMHTLHFMSLHHITFYIALHYITFTLHYTTSHDITSHHNTLRGMT